MRIKIFYRKSLKLSNGKLAAQVAHVAKELGRRFPSIPEDDTIIVLGVSDTKYKELCIKFQTEQYDWYQQIDNGLTEIVKGTPTAFGYIEYEKR